MAAPFFNEQNEVEGCVCFIYLKSVAANQDKIEELNESYAYVTFGIF